jgi:hypothetical protein
MTYNNRILKSTNKSKTTWNIVNELLGKQHSTNDIQNLTTEGSQLTKQHDIAEAFNKYFSSVTDKKISNILENLGQKSSSSYSYLDLDNGNHYPPMVFKSFSTHEIISITKSLKTKNSLDMMKLVQNC